VEVPDEREAQGGAGASGHVVEGGEDVAVKADEGGHGVARKGEEGRWAGPEGEGLAGTLGDAVKEGDAEEVLEHGADVIAFAFGDAAAGEDEVGGLERGLEGGGELIGAVGEVLGGDFAGAPGVEGGAEGGIVGAANLVGGRNLFGRNEFVAGGEDGDAGLADDGEGGGPDGGGDGGDAGGDHGAGGDKFGTLREVAAEGVDVGAGGGWGFGENGVTAVAFDLFVRDDGVAIIGEAGPGHDLPTGVIGEWFGGGVAGGVEAMDSDPGIGDGGVRGTEADAIHHDTIVGREGAVGGEGGGEDALIGEFERDIFGGEDGQVGEDEMLGFCGGDQGIHRRGG